MASSADVLTAIRELASAKQLDREELVDLLRDGIHAALVRKYGPTVRPEIDVDEAHGVLRVTILRTVVEAVEDRVCQVSLDEARFEDGDFQIGDVLEEEVPFQEFGRIAVQAAKQRIIQRVREGERSRIREEFADRVGELLSGEIQQIERGKLVIMLDAVSRSRGHHPLPRAESAGALPSGRYDPGRPEATRGDAQGSPADPVPAPTRCSSKRCSSSRCRRSSRGSCEIREAAREVGSRTKIAVVESRRRDRPGGCVRRSQGIARAGHRQ